MNMELIELGEYISKHQKTKYQLMYYWERYCKKCKNYNLEPDEEYSISFTFDDIGKTGYDWIFGLLINAKKDVQGEKITFIAEDPEEYICEKCKNEMWSQW